MIHLLNNNNEMQEKDFDNEWEVFLSKINTYANDAPEKWTAYTLLAYFLQKYKQVNDLDFVFSHTKRGPTTSKEMKNASRIWEMFNKGRYKQLKNKEEKLAFKIQLVDILKNYINWAFDVKFHGRQTNITGLGLFSVANFMNEFLQWRKAKKASLPKRSDALPQEFIEWININASEIYKKQQIKVLEDLNALFNYINAYSLDSNSIEYIVLNKAIDLNIMPKGGKLELDKK